MSPNFFIGLFAVCKFYDFSVFIPETLTFLHFRGIIYVNILIVLPHNADYVCNWRGTMNQEELRLHRCCFTGHRPEKMELGEKEIKSLLEKAIDEAIADGYVTFITGMAMGTDIWAAEIVLERKKMNKDLHLICALPHPNFETRRSMTEKMKFNKILKNADLVKEINDHYFPGCYQVRNEWMVDRSNLVIAVFNGQKSGTKNTVDYAKRKGVKVLNVL